MHCFKVDVSYVDMSNEDDIETLSMTCKEESSMMKHEDSVSQSGRSNEAMNDLDETNEATTVYDDCITENTELQQVRICTL